MPSTSLETIDAIVILSFRVSQGRDLRYRVTATVVNTTAAGLEEALPRTGLLLDRAPAVRWHRTLPGDACECSRRLSRALPRRSRPFAGVAVGASVYVNP